MKTDELLDDVVKRLSRETIPPSTGRIPVGSGEDISLNQSIPSLRMAGLIS